MSAVKPSPEDLLVAIRAHCLECSGGCRKEVERCRLKSCHLYPYRSVRAVGAEKKIRVKGEGKQISLFESIGEGGEQNGKNDED